MRAGPLRRFVPIAGCLLVGLTLLQAAEENEYRTVDFYEQNGPDATVLDGAAGQLHYNPSSERFDFTFTAIRLHKRIAYSLILSREPDVVLPARYQVLATGTSTSGGTLALSGSVDLSMDLIAGRILLIPTTQPPDKPMTYEGKYLVASRPIAYDDTDSELVCGRNQSPGPSDRLGPQVGDRVVDFTLHGIDGPDSITAGNAEQPLTSFTLSDLLKTQPVLLVNGAFT